MRGLFYGVLAVTVLTSGNVVVAAPGDSVQTARLVLKTSADSTFIDESSKRFLRLDEPADADLFATEERAQTSELGKLAKQLKLRRTVPNKYAAVIKAELHIKKQAFSVLDRKFLGLLKKRYSPKQAKNLGLIRGNEIQEYEKFLAKLVKARNPAAFKRG
ncbi:putative secreted RxLR effector protein [Phytophthora cinnamomi]|uniref:putative secreted RxLR effector protein n=1 Tax=Phytophthora cinnamomi TaxID=4785 RepID=UPI00355A44EA|nr:putative secreted RxLR effector protein [Phytophthora cinnamomi]